MMEKLPAKTGWIWIKQGVAIFRQQPAELSTLFFTYMFVMLAIGIIPVLGRVLPLMLIPIFSMTFMQACAYVQIKKKVYPTLLMVGFRSPQVKSLAILGVLYLVAALVAISASALIDGGFFFQVITGQLIPDENNVPGSNMTLAMLFAGLVYTPALMAFWFAAPLVAWQDMSVGKAIFYSFFAVWRAKGAFLVFGVIWIAINMILPAVVSTIVGMLLGTKIAILVLLPMSLILTVIMYCSFYPTYTWLFGAPPDFTNGEPPELD